MTLGEFREKTKDLPDNLELRILLRDNDNSVGVNIPVLKILPIKCGVHGIHGSFKEIDLVSKERW